jgi:putative GTP pyrophosphokinase
MTTDSVAPGLDFYDDNLPLFKRLLEEAKYILNEEIDFKVHSVPGHVKERTSVLNKIADRQYLDPANEMTDLVGLRIITLFESDLRKADASIRRAFDVVSMENKIDEANADTFGYMSVHYICTLKTEHQGPRYRNLHGFKFEVQSRTILMDAWANVSHYLAYKGKNSIPADKQRAFYALAGLFYVADKQFEQLLLGEGETASSSLSAVLTPDRLETDQPLDRDRVADLLESVFPSRDYGDAGDEDRLASISNFVEEADTAGLKTIGKLRDTLEAGKLGALAYEKDRPPPSGRMEQSTRPWEYRARLQA